MKTRKVLKSTAWVEGTVIESNWTNNPQGYTKLITDPQHLTFANFAFKMPSDVEVESVKVKVIASRDYTAELNGDPSYPVEDYAGINEDYALLPTFVYADEPIARTVRITTNNTNDLIVVYQAKSQTPCNITINKLLAKVIYFAGIKPDSNEICFY